VTQPFAATQLYAATAQIAKANLPWSVAGLVRLSDAEDREAFSVAPVDDGGAYRHAAYWQAVASRLLGSGDLLQAATSAEHKAMASSLISGDAQTSAILREASQNIGRAVANAAGNTGTQGRSDASAVASILAQYASPAAIELAQREDDSYTGWLRKWQKSMQTAGKIAVFATVGISAVLLGALVWYASRSWKSARRNPLKIASAAVTAVRKMAQIGASA
jgi:hypothetical protein